MSKRINLALSDKSWADVTALRDATGLPSNAEVIRRSLTILQMISEEQAAGSKLYLKEPDGTLVRLRLV